MDYTKLCQDCRFAELHTDDEEISSWVCSHPTSSYQGERSPATGILPEPWQLGCGSARFTDYDPQRCGPTARYWERR